MDCMKIFSFCSQLNQTEKELIQKSVQTEKYEKGMVMHRSENSCKGLMAVLTGQLRTYILSDEGREVTLFRVYEGEVCVLSASCLMDSISFDVMIEAAQDTEVLIIPSVILNQVMGDNPYVELYLYKAAAEKFSEVMWTMQQILFQKIDQRVAQFLWDEMLRSNSQIIKITHDELARYIGSAREVVTKVLKYLSVEKAVELRRGQIIVSDKEKLKKFL